MYYYIIDCAWLVHYSPIFEHVYFSILIVW